MQGKRFLDGILAWLVCLGLAACQPGTLPVSQAFSSIPTMTMTLTPFQASSPTPRPTLTATPTITVTPSLTPTATPEPCLEQQGSIEQFEIAFGENRAPMAFRVYVHPCYGRPADARYPVLFMIHGQTYSDDQWDRLGLDEAADEMISSGKAAPFLMVMPREANTFEDIFTSAFEPDLVEGLVPWVDANYQTCAERRCRAIGGLSRGGAWAFRLGFIHWDLFGAIGLHSTPPFIGDHNRLPGWLAQIPPDQMPRIFMDTGRQDWYIRSTTQLEGLLVQYGVPHEWYLFNGAHEEAYWSAHAADYLAWYTQPWSQ